MTVRPPRRLGTVDDVRDLYKRVRILEALDNPFSGTGSFQTYRECVTQQDDLLAYMPLSDPLGSVTVEEVIGDRVTSVEYGDGGYPIFGKPGVFAGLPGETQPEFSNSGASFPYSDGQITMNLSAADKLATFAGTHAWAMKMWILRPGDQANGSGFLWRNWSGTGSNASQCELVTSGADNYLVFTRGVTSIGASGTTAIPVSTETEVWFTYDGATMRVYINQVLVESGASAANITAGDFLYVGNNANLTGSGFRIFTGMIAHVQLYSAANTDGCDPQGFEGGACGPPFQVVMTDGACGWTKSYPITTYVNGA